MIMLFRALIILTFVFFSFPVQAGDEPESPPEVKTEINKAPDSPDTSDPSDQEIMEMTEFLEMMECLEEMELLDNLDVLEKED